MGNRRRTTGGLLWFVGSWFWGTAAFGLGPCPSELARTISPPYAQSVNRWLDFVSRHPYEFTIQYPPRREYFQEFFRAPVPTDFSAHRPNLLYVHVPFCEKKCYFCNFAVDIRNKSDVYTRYVDGVLRELDRYAPIFFQGQEIRGIDIGGGTPTRLPLPQLERLLRALDPFRALSPHPFPLSIETTPTIASEEPDKLATLAALGAERVSMGIQSFNEEALALVNRAIHRGKNERAAENIRRAGFARYNIDLIFGLPAQTEREWSEDLERVVQLAPDSITTYDCLYRGKGRALTKQAPSIPDADDYGRLYDLAYTFLTAHGYHAPYASVNFSRRPAETGTSAYFEGRLLDGFPYLGVGNYSSSWLGDLWFFNVYRVDEYLGRAFAGETSVGDFYRLPAEELFAKYILYSLNYGEIDTQRFYRRFQVDFDAYYGSELRVASERGWMEKDGPRWKISRGQFKNLPGVRSLFYSLKAQTFLHHLHP